MSSRLICRGLHRGIHPVLASSVFPLHPFREEETIFDLVQATDLLPHWTTRLAGPFGLPRTRRQDASTPLLQPTFTSRALDIDTPSGDCLPIARGSPRRLTASRPAPGELVRCRHLAFQDPAPDRLSVIRPPAAMRLTAHLPASVRSTAAWTLARPSGRLRRFFGSPDALSIRPSDALVQQPSFGPLSPRGGRSALRPPDPGSPRARQCQAADPRSRRLPSYGTDPGALARSLFGALLRLAGRCSFRAFSPLC